MFCTNCGKAFPDTEKACPYCGAEKMDIQSLESESRQNQTGENGRMEADEPQTWKDKLTNFAGMACAALILIGLCIGAKNWIQDHYAQHKLYTVMYGSAVEEVEGLLSNVSNVEIGNYDKDHVVFQEYEYCDFGYGRLRYARYAVSVPAEWDTVSGHMDESLTIRVFHYTSDQNVSDGVDTSVPDHIQREDVFQEFDEMIENLENLGNFDDWD